MSADLIEPDAPKPEEIKELEQHLTTANPRIFDGVNKKKKAEILKSVSYTLVHSRTHSGPLPTPEMLAQYNEIIPNGAERIMNQWENQQSHRHFLEKTVIPAQVRQSGRGQYFGFALGIAGLACATVLGLYGFTTVASIIGGGTVVSLVTVFVVGKKSMQDDLQQKKLPEK